MRIKPGMTFPFLFAFAIKYRDIKYRKIKYKEIKYREIKYS